VTTDDNKLLFFCVQIAGDFLINRNRNIQQLVEQSFDHVELKRFTPENFPDLMAHFYKGCATKKSI